LAAEITKCEERFSARNFAIFTLFFHAFFTHSLDHALIAYIDRL